jgi:hypothetical protein
VSPKRHARRAAREYARTLSWPRSFLRTNALTLAACAICFLIIALPLSTAVSAPKAAGVGGVFAVALGVAAFEPWRRT